MARVKVFEGGNIQRQMPTQERYRPADYGPGGLATGLQQAGKGLAEVVQRQDEVEDLKARVEANRLAIEQDDVARQISRRVKETLGEGAEAAAEQGATELDQATKDILGRAGPRARLLLESTLAHKVGTAKDEFFSHGFREKATALETSTVARINRVVETASDVDDEAAALAMLSEIRGLNEQRASFFGKGEDWLALEDQKVVSQFYKSRTLKLAVGPNGSALAAIEYATANRANLTDDDYNSIVTAYNDNALDDLVAAMQDGAPLPSATTETRDPLAPLPEDEEEQTRFLDPVAFFKSFTVPHEGRTYVVDSNGAGVKYGINAAFNPGVDVKNLTEAQAARIFTEKYFKRSGADKLPPALAAVHADTFFLNEKQAMKMLKESGGDVDRYLQLRRNFLNGLARTNPAKYGRYQRGWENRTAALEQFANRQGTDGRPMPVSPDTPLDDYRAQVMARTDIGLTLKRKLIARAEQRRAEVRQERAIVEEEAQRALTTAITALGQNFTDIKQLPQDAWLRASPATRAALTEAAKTNRENKPVPLNVEAQIGFIQTFAPEKLADPAVQQDLMRKGVPASRIADLAQQGGQALGRKAGAKPDPVSTSQLEGVARPAFEAAGIHLWTLEGRDSEGRKVKSGTERQEDSARKLRAMQMLQGYANQWAANNPGKVADENTIRGWVANVLRRVQHGETNKPFFDLSDDQVVINMSAADRESIKRRLREGGLPVTTQNVAEYYRRLYIGR